MRSFWQDIRYTMRTLRDAPGFTLAAILTLGLAMALNTTMFSIINGLVLRPLAVPHPEQIAVLFATQDGRDGYQEFSYPDYQDIRGALKDLSEVVGATNSLVRLGANGKLDRVTIVAVTPNYFPALGIQPA